MAEDIVVFGNVEASLLVSPAFTLPAYGAAAIIYVI
jgi:hypothetical protein